MDEGCLRIHQAPSWRKVLQLFALELLQARPPLTADACVFAQLWSSLQLDLIAWASKKLVLCFEDSSKNFSMMNAEVSGRHLRVFASVVQCIARLGKDVFWEASTSGVSAAKRKWTHSYTKCCTQVVIRTLNDSKSVFCAYYFEPGKPSQIFQTKRERNSFFPQHSSRAIHHPQQMHQQKSNLKSRFVHLLSFTLGCILRLSPVFVVVCV